MIIDTYLNITVRARAAAIAWGNAFLAAAQDEDRRVLYRSLSIECFEHGLQFIGCDGHALFRAWVPAIPDEAAEAPWPDISEAPDRAIIVMDPDGFGLAFMKALLKVTNDEAHEYEQLIITSADADDEVELSLGDEFMSERLTLRACGQRLDLKLSEEKYPAWRRLQLGVEAAERVDGMTVAARLLALTGKIKGANSVDLEFYGDTKHIAFTAHGECEVRGLLMPMRRQTVEA